MTMASADLLDVALESLGYMSADGFVQHETEWTASARSFVWRELRNKGGVDAAYFRGGVPLVAFARAEDRRGVAEIQRRLWNLSRVPILVASTTSDISAYSCFVVPSGDLDAENALLKTANTRRQIPQVLKEFSRFQIESGRVLSSYGGQFRRSDRVDRRLLENLRHLRRSLPANGDERRRALDDFIGRTIFIRYFEDRGILSPDHLSELTRFDSFLDVLRAGIESTYTFFESLSARFNGDILRPTHNERNLIKDGDLLEIASFFSGTDVKTGQQSFWPYDFSVIPPELISSIYEQLLEENQKSDAAYYTPRPVVDLILDEALPWDSSPSSVRLLDPSCGSGIFLTEAFRRLVFRNVVRNGTSLDFDTLSRLLTDSIFGLDRNPVAVNVAALGLYLALLEELDNPTAWRYARLPRLTNSNLLACDFFSDHAMSNERFDIVVGNPPWQSKLTKFAADYLRSRELTVPDRQIALAFAFRAYELLNDGGTLAMLLPSKPLLHNKSPQAVKTRVTLFDRLEVEMVMDLSGLRRETFHSSVAPAAVLLARRGIPPNEGELREILHVVLRNSRLHGSIDGFIVSQDDVHRIPRPLANSSPDIWKTLLWGTMGDRDLIARLRSSNRSLLEIVAERNWIHGNGFQSGGGDQNDASEIRGLALIPTRAIQAFATTEADDSYVTATVLHRPRNPRLYNAPHVLIRRGLVLGRPVAAFVNKDAAFNNGVFGIAAPEADIAYLRLLAGYVNSSLGHYYQFLTCSSWGVERDYIEENEHLSLPFAEPQPRQASKVLEAVAAAEESGFSPNSRQQLDESVFDAYGLNEDEVNRIMDMLEVGLSQFDHRFNSRAFEAPTDSMIQAYLNKLRTVLESSLTSVRLETSVADKSQYYIVAAVRFAASEGNLLAKSATPQSIIKSLIIKAEETANAWPSPTTILQPSLLLLQDSDVYLVKPNEQRYWTVTSAHDDAAEVVSAITRSTGLTTWTQ